MLSENKYLALSEDCSLRNLETPCVYNKLTDELYELDQEAYGFLLRCNGSATVKGLGGDPEFLSYCITEGILTSLFDPHVRHQSIGKSPSNSLRYLELHLTERCNLRCRHCYLSAGEGADLDLLNVFKVLDEFDTMQGVRLLLSGGEPLMHKGFWYINEKMSDYGFRSVLLTNGTLITTDVARRLKVHEAQISLDGMRGAHDALRGAGTFNKAVQGIRHLTDAGINVSVATIINSLNADDFGRLGQLLDFLGVTEWNVDMPSVAGRFNDNTDLLLPPAEAGRYLSYGTGGGHHGGGEGLACGSHLCAVGPRGQVAKCGFYLGSPVGQIKEGLAMCWDRLAPVLLGNLSCDCEHLDACRGGCRFRAESYTGEFGPDPVRCFSLGVVNKQTGGGGMRDNKEGN